MPAMPRRRPVLLARQRVRCLSIYTNERSGVTERSTPSQVESQPPRRGVATSSLDAAIIALRRGEPVLLTGGRDGAVLVAAAELVSDDNLRRLREISAR